MVRHVYNSPTRRHQRSTSREAWAKCAAISSTKHLTGPAVKAPPAQPCRDALSDILPVMASK